MKWILLVALLICILLPERVQTIDSTFSCSGRVQGPPCQELFFADTVFIGTVREVVTVPFPSSPHPDWQEYQKLTARLSVEETFRGEISSEITYEGKDCYYPFKQGEKYLIYAQKTADGKLYLTRDTTRTRLLSEAGEDLEYIRNLSGMPDGGRIYGKVYNHVQPATLRGYITSERVMPGVKVVAEASGQRHETTTDSTGSYEFLRLPEGIYKMRALVPKYFSGVEAESRLSNKGCAPVNFSIQATGTIAGKVLAPDGQPVYNAMVSVFSNEGVTEELIEGLKPYYEQRDVTDKQGQFKFDRLPSGQYFIAVNLVKHYEKESGGRFPRTFYPGVRNLSDSSVITLGDGEQKQNIELKLPSLKTPE